MPIEVGFWRTGGKLERVMPSSLAFEKSLEDHIVDGPSILAPGHLVLELRRDRTPREVVTQVLDFGRRGRSPQVATAAGVRDVICPFRDAASIAGGDNRRFTPRRGVPDTPRRREAAAAP